MPSKASNIILIFHCYCLCSIYLQYVTSNGSYKLHNIISIIVLCIQAAHHLYLSTMHTYDAHDELSCCVVNAGKEGVVHD